MQELMLSWAGSGGTRNALTKEMIQSFEILAPKSIDEQQAIANILGSLDDKIELNRRMNQTLEAIARALFKSWFVDFDPVRAKMEGRQPAGMDAETAALFPDSFEDSHIGEIPKGWSVERFSDHFSVAKGLSYKGAGLASEENGLPFHNLKSIKPGGGYNYEGIKWYSGDYKPRHEVQPGDLIVANTDLTLRDEVIGHAAIVPASFGDSGLLSHHLFIMKPRHDSAIQKTFMYYLLGTRKYHDTVFGYTNGTTVNMLPADGLEKPKFAVPPKALLDVFCSFAKPVQTRIEAIYEESRTLADIRDALLPKLISGEICVKDTENFVEEHAG